MTAMASLPKARPVTKRRLWARTPNPKVARARNSPDRRMAGMARSAPAGTMTSAARGRAIPYGTPAERKCDRVVAPKTTNTAWHSDTWRDRPTSSERLAKISTKATVVVAVRSCEPLRTAGSARATATSATSAGTGGRACARRWVRPPQGQRLRPGDLGEAALAAGHQDDEEDDERQCRGQPGQAGLGGHGLGRHRRGHPDGVGADLGAGEAPEPPDDGRPEGLHHQKGQQQGVELDERGEQHAGEGGEGAAQHPAERGHPAGVGPDQFGQLPVADHGPGLQAEMGPAEEVGQGDPGRHGHADDDRLVDADVHPRDPERPGREDGRHLAGVPPVDGHGQRLQGHKEAEGRHDVGGGGGPLETAEEETVDEHPEQRGDHQHRQRDGQRRGQAGVHPQGIEDVGGEHPHRAVGEVEHPRRGVGQHQPHRGQGVDGPGDETDDDEGQVAAHRAPHSPQGARPASIVRRSTAVVSRPASDAQPARWNRWLPAATRTSVSSHDPVAAAGRGSCRRRSASCSIRSRAPKRRSLRLTVLARIQKV